MSEVKSQLLPDYEDVVRKVEIMYHLNHQNDIKEKYFVTLQADRGHYLEDVATRVIPDWIVAQRFAYNWLRNARIVEP